MQEMREIVEKALSLAKGGWQRDLVNFGLLKLRGRASYWRGAYIASATNFVERLRKNGIPAVLYVREFRVGIILGKEWVEAFELLQQLRQEALSLASTLQRLAQDRKAALRLRGRSELRHLAAELRRKMEWLIQLNQSHIDAIYDGNELSQILTEASRKRTIQLTQEECERILSKWRQILCRHADNAQSAPSN